MKIKVLQLSFCAIIFLIVIGTSTLIGQTNTWDGSSSSNWNTAANWSLNLVPTSAHNVVIPNGITTNITVNTAAVCNSFTMNSGATNNTVTISTGNSLTVTGAVTINNTTAATKILAVATGNLSCASITMSNTSSNSDDCRVTISTGTVNVSGNITMNGVAARNQIEFSGAGTLNLGGSISGGDLISATGSTVNYNGSSAQTVAINSDYVYTNLHINNTAGATLQASITTTNVTGNIRIQTGTLSNGGFAIAGASADNFEVANGAIFILTGTSSMASGFTKTFGLTSTVDYAGGIQTISPENYGNLTVSAGSKTIAASAVVYVNGNLTNSGTITMTAGTSSASTWLRMSGNVTNNLGATIDATASYTRFIFTGTVAQTLTNNGTMTSPVASFDVANSHASGLTLSGSNNIVVTRANLFYGLVTNSNRITLGTGGSSYATVQRGVASNTNPAGSFDVAPGFNAGTGGYILLYDDGSVAYNTGYEIPGSLTCDLFYIFDAADVSLTSDLTINTELNFYGGTGTPTLRIGSHTLTLGGTITYTVAGAFYGGTSSNLVMNGATTLNSIINGLNNFTINANTTLGGAIAVNGTLNLSSGVLNNGSYLSMATGTTIIRSGGSISSVPTFGTSVNVTYSGASSIFTGLEIPSGTTVLNNLTTNTGGVVQSGSYSSPANILTDAFSNLTSWTGDIGAGNNQFTTVSSNNAGGTSTECRYLYGSSSTTSYTASIYRSVNTTGYAALNIQWKQFIDNYDADTYPYSISVQCATSTSGPWTDIYTLIPTGTANIGPATISYNNWTTNVGGNFYIRFYITGYTYGLDYWYFDDLVIDGTTLTPSTTTVNGTFDLTNGTYSIGANTLAINGVISGANAIIGGTSSNMSVGGTGTNLTLPAITSGLNNFSITRPNGVSISPTGTLTVSGTLSNTAGNNGLVIKSDVTGTGSLISATAGVDGTVQRYLTKMKWHFIGMPTETGLAGSFHLSSGHSDIYLRTHIESTNTWGPYIVPVSTPLIQGRGYETWVGNPGFNQDETILFPGKLNAGNYTTGSGNFYTLEYTTGHGLNLICNPYPSALQANIHTWTKTNVSNKVYVWDPVYGNYRYWNGLSGTPPPYTGYGTLTSGVIPEMQAFFVEATASGPSLTIPQSDRIHSSQAFYKDAQIPLNTLRFDVTGNDYEDAIFVNFNELSTQGYDTDFDVEKLFGLNEAPQLYSEIPGKKLSINSLPALEEDLIIPIGFECGAPADFSISASGFDGFDQNVGFYLEDLKNGIVQNLRNNPVYIFDSSPLNEASRFLLHFANPNTVDETLVNPIRIFADHNEIHILNLANGQVKISVFDLTGRQIAENHFNGQDSGIIEIQNGTGYYLVKVQTGLQLITQKVFIK